MIIRVGVAAKLAIASLKTTWLLISGQDPGMLALLAENRANFSKG
jgi:hypothetical protein